MRPKSILLVFVSLLLSPLVVANDVVVSGEVANPGSYQLTKKVRLSTMVKAVSPKDSACIHQASYFRFNEKMNQIEDFESFLFDVKALSTFHKKDKELSDYFSNLYQLLSASKPEGRVLPVVLDLSALEVSKSFNWVMSKGDRLLYPACSDYQYYIDSNGLKGQLEFVSTHQLNDYAKLVDTRYFHEPGYLVSIAADGEVNRVKVGYWASGQVRYISSAAWMFRPIKSRYIDPINASFNEELAYWISLTLAADGASQ